MLFTVVNDPPIDGFHSYSFFTRPDRMDLQWTYFTSLVEGEPFFRQYLDWDFDIFQDVMNLKKATVCPE